MNDDSSVTLSQDRCTIQQEHNFNGMVLKAINFRINENLISYKNFKKIIILSFKKHFFEESFLICY